MIFLFFYSNGSILASIKQDMYPASGVVVNWCQYFLCALVKVRKRGKVDRCGDRVCMRCGSPAEGSHAFRQYNCRNKIIEILAPAYNFLTLGLIEE